MTLRELLAEHGVDVPLLLERVAVGEGAQPCGRDVEAAVSASLSAVGRDDLGRLTVEIEVFDWRRLMPSHGGA